MVWSMYGVGLEFAIGLKPTKVRIHYANSISLLQAKK